MEGPTILMVDEVFPQAPKKKSGENLIYDWTSLELSPKVDLIMAVSPAPSLDGQSFQLKPPTHPNLFSHQMLEGHRNFAQLHRLLSCVKVHNKDLPSGKKDKDTVSLIDYHFFVV